MSESNSSSLLSSSNSLAMTVVEVGGIKYPIEFELITTNSDMKTNVISTNWLTGNFTPDTELYQFVISLISNDENRSKITLDEISPEERAECEQLASKASNIAARNLPDILETLYSFALFDLKTDDVLIDVYYQNAKADATPNVAFILLLKCAQRATHITDDGVWGKQSEDAFKNKSFDYQKTIIKTERFTPEIRNKLAAVVYVEAASGDGSQMHDIMGIYITLICMKKTAEEGLSQSTPYKSKGKKILDAIEILKNPEKYKEDSRTKNLLIIRKNVDKFLNNESLIPFLGATGQGNMYDVNSSDKLDKNVNIDCEKEFKLFRDNWTFPENQMPIEYPYVDKDTYLRFYAPHLFNEHMEKKYGAVWLSVMGEYVTRFKPMSDTTVPEKTKTRRPEWDMVRAYWFRQQRGQVKILVHQIGKGQSAQFLYQKEAIRDYWLREARKDPLLKQELDAAKTVQEQYKIIETLTIHTPMYHP